MVAERFENLLATPNNQGGILERACKDIAHRLWHERGCPLETPWVDWQEAQRLLVLEIEKNDPDARNELIRLWNKPPCTCDNK